MSLSSSFPPPHIIGGRSSPPVYCPGFTLPSLFLNPAGTSSHLRLKHASSIVPSMTRRPDFHTNGSAAADDDDEDDDIQYEELDADDPFLPERWDVLGLGQAMVFFLLVSHCFQSIENNVN